METTTQEIYCHYCGEVIAERQWEGPLGNAFEVMVEQIRDEHKSECSSEWDDWRSTTTEWVSNEPICDVKLRKDFTPFEVIEASIFDAILRIPPCPPDRCMEDWSREIVKHYQEVQSRPKRRIRNLEDRNSPNTSKIIPVSI